MRGQAVVREGSLKEGELLGEREKGYVSAKGPFQPWATDIILIPLISANRLVVMCELSQLTISTLLN